MGFLSYGGQGLADLTTGSGPWAMICPNKSSQTTNAGRLIELVRPPAGSTRLRIWGSEVRILSGAPKLKLIQKLTWNQTYSSYRVQIRVRWVSAKTRRQVWVPAIGGSEVRPPPSV
jgi:hypothetical protein